MIGVHRRDQKRLWSVRDLIGQLARRMPTDLAPEQLQDLAAYAVEEPYSLSPTALETVARRLAATGPLSAELVAVLVDRSDESQRLRQLVVGLIGPQLDPDDPWAEQILTELPTLGPAWQRLVGHANTVTTAPALGRLVDGGDPAAGGVRPGRGEAGPRPVADRRLPYSATPTVLRQRGPAAGPALAGSSGPTRHPSRYAGSVAWSRRCCAGCPGSGRPARRSPTRGSGCSAGSTARRRWRSSPGCRPGSPTRAPARRSTRRWTPALRRSASAGTRSRSWPSRTTA